MPIQCNQSFQVDIKRFKLHLISKYFSLVCNQGQFDKVLLDLEMKSYWPKQIWADFKMIIMFLISTWLLECYFLLLSSYCFGHCGEKIGLMRVKTSKYCRV